MKYEISVIPAKAPRGKSANRPLASDMEPAYLHICYFMLAHAVMGTLPPAFRLAVT
ncbi:hypothetical protein J2W49_003305 [Hydrogenophaga palleronii]|uniref:Uncharacterized protein n=1 Tax=Hydrogenophaga palleronii TaxID=65655 RepID=A0ABU1WQK4_9BURK|nr:hypothetical protein [Hydrogenophaga palleronii]